MSVGQRLPHACELFVDFLQAAHFLRVIHRRCDITIAEWAGLALTPSQHHVMHLRAGLPAKTAATVGDGSRNQGVSTEGWPGIEALVEIPCVFVSQRRFLKRQLRQPERSIL